jgi:nickel/cobalt transporter (NiCoT) family protein
VLATLRRILSDDSPGLRAKIIGVYGVLFSANLILWALTIVTAVNYPVFLLLAATAYTLGLRHAFDADHIAAIDNVTLVSFSLLGTLLLSL